MLSLLIAGLLIIVFLEAPRLVLERLWKELAVFLVLWGIASSMAVAQFMGVELLFKVTEFLNAIFAPGK